MSGREEAGINGTVHKEQIVCAIRMRFGSVAAFERAHDLPKKSVSEELRKRCSRRVRDAIEAFLREDAAARAVNGEMSGLDLSREARILRVLTPLDDDDGDDRRGPARLPNPTEPRPDPRSQTPAPQTKRRALSRIARVLRSIAGLPSTLRSWSRTLAAGKPELPRTCALHQSSRTHPAGGDSHRVTEAAGASSSGRGGAA